MNEEDMVNSASESIDGAQMDWPVFSIRHTYCPKDISADVSFEPNELVMYDTTSEEIEGRWISASYGSYVPISDVR